MYPGAQINEVYALSRLDLLSKLRRRRPDVRATYQECEIYEFLDRAKGEEHQAATGGPRGGIFSSTGYAERLFTMETKDAKRHIFERKKKEFAGSKVHWVQKREETPFYASRSPRTHFLTHLSFDMPQPQLSHAPESLPDQGVVYRSPRLQ